MKQRIEEYNFERNKNLKALGITTTIIGGLFLLFFLVSWTIPALPPEILNEGVEVNLGNSDEGLGDVAPLLPGDPSITQESNFNPSPATTAQANTQPEVAENTDADATPVNTAAKPEIKPKPNNSNNTVVKNKPVQPVVNPNPAPPKPKAVYAGGTNTAAGGNNSDTYNNSKNQGIAGGKGDQGKPNGNPNSDSYDGNAPKGTSGISISRGLDGRKITSTARFEDEYKNGGKVSVDVTVDENGTVTSANVKPGNPFADLNAIAKRRAMQLKFSKGDAPQTGTVIIVFQNPKG